MPNFNAPKDWKVANQEPTLTRIILDCRVAAIDLARIPSLVKPYAEISLPEKTLTIVTIPLPTRKLLTQSLIRFP